MPEGTERRFLHALFGDAPPELWALLWTLPNKVSHWYQVAHLDDAATFAASSALDTYVGVALSPADYGESRRCLAGDTAGIVAVWADVDYAGEMHRKSNLPPTEEDALALVNECGLDPSIVVHSGHGIQAWWLLDEPWVFTDDEDRLRGADLAQRWNMTLASRAKHDGWTIDATHDLARVLRMPGTMNRKAKPAVPVSVLMCDETRRYAPSDIEAMCVEADQWPERRAKSQHVVGTLVLNANAEPPFDKVEALKENDAKFARTWRRDRRLKDDSASGWDLSLATQAANAGLSDQEIVDLLIAYRRKHGDDPKLRLDYYQRTLTTARNGVQGEAQAEALAEAQAEAAAVVGDNAARLVEAQACRDAMGEQSARHDLLGSLSEAARVERGGAIKFTRIVRRVSDTNPTFRIETTIGSIAIGSAERVLAQHAFKAAIAGATLLQMIPMKAEPWRTFTAALLAAAEDEDTGEESTNEGRARAWLWEYLQERAVFTDVQEAVTESMSPYVHEGRVFIFGPTLRQWLARVRGERMTAREMGVVLRDAHWTTAKINARVGAKKRTSHQVWCVGAASEWGIDPEGQEGVIEPLPLPEEDS